MTSFISSFLVEPVIRQARRFSRPSSAPPPNAVNGALTGSANVSVEEKDGDTTAVEEDDSNASALENQHGREEPAQSSTTHHLVASPIASPSSETASFPATSDTAQTLSASSHFSSSSDSTDRDDVLRERERWPSWPNNFSNPALHGIPRHFQTGSRSTTNSITSIDSEMTPAENANMFNGEDESRGRSTSNNSRMGDGALPADDGMGKLRKQIIDIQSSNASSTEKSRLVHRLMTKNYTSSQTSLYNPNSAHLRSPESIRCPEDPSVPTSTKSHSDTRIPVTLSSNSVSREKRDPLFPELTPEDLAPTYYIEPISSQNLIKEGSVPVSRRTSEGGEEEKHLGCPHYRRNVKLQCSECLKWYTCRFCHDAVEDHSLVRRDTKQMLCMLCGTAQAASAECTSCGERSAWYYCDVCKLWNDDPQQSIYHCDDCGICRVGQGLGKDFYHCKVRRIR